MKIKFIKMSAGGNDFIVIDRRCRDVPFAVKTFARQACRRKFSIGADGVLLLESSPSADVNLSIFNPDGSEAEMCGNGACCTALYINYESRKKHITINTKAGILKAVIAGENKVKLKMSTPEDMRSDLKAELGNINYTLYFLNTGVPHTVIFVEELENIPVDEWGRKIRYLEAFSPHGTNVDFTKVRDTETLSLRVYERGVEKETLSCGTGAVAAAVVAAKTGRIRKFPVNIHTRHSCCLRVHLCLEGEKITEVYLETKAQISYTGEIKWQN